MQIRIILKVWNFLEFLGNGETLVTRNYWEFLGILSISNLKENVLGISENNLEW